MDMFDCIEKQAAECEFKRSKPISIPKSKKTKKCNCAYQFVGCMDGQGHRAFLSRKCCFNCHLVRQRFYKVAHQLRESEADIDSD